MYNISEYIKEGLNYDVRDDGVVDFTGDCELKDWLSDIPFKIGKVNGNFSLKGYKNSTLSNIPEEVVGNFEVTKSQLEELDLSKISISGDINVAHNYLTKLILPVGFSNNLDCTANFLTSLSYVNKGKVFKSGNFIDPSDCSRNSQKELEEFFRDFFENFMDIGGYLSYDNDYSQETNTSERINRLRGKIIDALKKDNPNEFPIEEFEKLLERKIKANQHVDIIDL